jgi:hypothetical protein
MMGAPGEVAEPKFSRLSRPLSVRLRIRRRAKDQAPRRYRPDSIVALAGAVSRAGQECSPAAALLRLVGRGAEAPALAAPAATR